MNNRKLKKLLIEIPIYKYWFYIETDENIVRDILLSYNSEYDIKTHLEDGGYSAKIYGLDDRISLIYIKDRLKSVLNHEIVHLATRVLDNGDSYDFRENDENLCYVIEYITKLCYNKLGIVDEF